MLQLSVIEVKRPAAERVRLRFALRRRASWDKS